MIKKLRKRFIVASMLSLFIVLAVIMSIVSFISYKKIVRRADETLDILADNNGRFPSGSYMEEYGLNPNESIELPYESRFFSVLPRGLQIQSGCGRVGRANYISRHGARARKFQVICFNRNFDFDCRAHNRLCANCAHVETHNKAGFGKL